MTSSRTFERWTTIAALFVLISQLPLLSWPARAAAEPQALLPPTPLVLKDGRIANVSIHVLPFETGASALADDVAVRLTALTAQVATDCFLTAQVIGHVSSREVAENETLAAHRLARSRADAVQTSLIGGGLPAKAIASVWDWQFLVREPRVTLWLFRLVQGEDCEGAPLDGGQAPLVAEGGAGQAGREQTAAAVPPAPETAGAPRQDQAAPAERTASDLAGVVSSAVAAEAAPRAEGAAVAAAKPSEEAAAQPQDAAVAPADRPGQDVAVAPAHDAAPTVTRPLPALSPAQPSPLPDTATAASDTVTAAPDTATAAPGPQEPAGAVLAATQPSAEDEHPERRGKVEAGQDNVVITFATNSSYFPPGTTRRLRSLLGGMASGGRYRVELAVGVSGSDTVVGAKSPEEARQYNRWLAERRLSRVREWLDENAEDRQLEIAPTFQADDSSRRVVVRVAPVS